MILLDTTIDVHYRFLNLHSQAGDGVSDVSAGTRGQANGLCGAAVPGELSMVTGTHTGAVHVTVELHDTEPPLDDVWEEAVEVSFASAADDLAAGDALTAAGMRGEPWVEQRLREMEEGRFPEHGVMSFSIAVEDDQPETGLSVQSAFEALAQAGRPESLTAACGALHRHDPADDVLSRVRQAFPQLNAG